MARVDKEVAALFNAVQRSAAATECCAKHLWRLGQEDVDGVAEALAGCVELVLAAGQVRARACAWRLRRLQLANLRLNAARRCCPCSPALSPTQAREAAGRIGGARRAACARLCTRAAERPRAARTPPPAEVPACGALRALPWCARGPGP